MTLLIAFLLMSHMNIENGFAYFAVFLLWIAHVFWSPATKTIENKVRRS